LSLASKAPPGSGEIVIEGATRSGGLLGVSQRSLHWTLRFDDAGQIRIESLPPMKGSATVLLDSGVRITIPLELVEGDNDLSYEL
jgi:hypothetical protein